MTHVAIIHGWKGRPDTNWKPWLAHQLQERGIKADVPAMPNPDNPIQSEWVDKIAQTIGTPAIDTYLVGHSLGCIAILRYLETLDENQKIGGAIFVAGFGHELKFDGYNGEHDSFFKKPLNWKTIRKRCHKFVAIHSDNDPHVGRDNLDLFKENLGAETILTHGQGHYGSDDGHTKLEIVLEKLIAFDS
jgi:uncharacterized protein